MTTLTRIKLLLIVLMLLLSTLACVDLTTAATNALDTNGDGNLSAELLQAGAEASKAMAQPTPLVLPAAAP